MLEIVFSYDERGLPFLIRARGHADWDVLGKDIVCAAASAVLQAAWVGLVEVAEIAVDAERASGRLTLQWDQTASETPSVLPIVATARVACMHLAVQYPKHLRVETRGPTTGKEAP